MFIGRQDGVFDFFRDHRKRIRIKDSGNAQWSRSAALLLYSFSDVISLSDVMDERLQAAGVNQNVGLMARLLMLEAAKKLFSGCKHTNALESGKRKSFLQTLILTSP